MRGRGHRVALLSQRREGGGFEENVTLSKTFGTEYISNFGDKKRSKLVNVKSILNIEK